VHAREGESHSRRSHNRQSSGRKTAKKPAANPVVNLVNPLIQGEGLQQKSERKKAKAKRRVSQMKTLRGEKQEAGGGEPPGGA